MNKYQKKVHKMAWHLMWTYWDNYRNCRKQVKKTLKNIKKKSYLQLRK